MAIKSKSKKKPLTAQQVQEKVQKEHRSLVRSVFTGAGFIRLTGFADKEFTFDGQKSDFDDGFVYENVIVFCEYTVTTGVGAHLKPKKIVYDKIISKPIEFIDFLKTRFPDIVAQLPSSYHKSKLVVRIVYCSKNEFDENYKLVVPDIAYMDYPALRYFVSVVDAVRKSARYELLHFLGIELKNVGDAGRIVTSTSSNEYHGSILPEAHSNFDDGYKVVSFYADPEALLKTAYVLRADGWRDSLNLYQRMISRSKVEGIRAYLKREKRVFINNIIVTLPSEVKPLNNDGETIDTKTLTDTAPVKIKLPNMPNSVGLIDGQHRVFAYHETLADDPEIAALRVQQNLLVTGIIYPKDLKAKDREKFEAKLFLEINSTQTSAKAPLKQAIGMVLEPFSAESIAARILSGLAKTGPLAGFVQQHFYDTDKLKTASIVSFGLRPLVKAKGNDSIFAIWDHVDKEKLSEQSDEDLLDNYIAFCISTINVFLSSVKRNINSERWTTDSKVPGRVLATTYVNSFLITLRLLIEKSMDLDQTSILKKLSGLNDFNFGAYHSSQYAKMAENIVGTFFVPSQASQVPNDTVLPKPSNGTDKT